MNSPVKIALYVALAIVASVSGFFALSGFGQLMDRSGDRTSELEQIEPERKTPEEAAGTNTATSTNNSVAAATNVAAGDTNASAGAVASDSATPTALGGKTAGPGEKPKVVGRIGLWTGLFVVSLIGLGLMIASDVSHFLGNRALKTLYNDEGEGVKNPEYEKAEEVWANGNHLEAISMMREYLSRNPREQHVAIRIAEIYEKDLNNHLAAALEYEEVLKHKLPADRWGWAAIHLCNLYFKLNQEQKAYPLLRRIVDDYPETPAADKARKRLEQVEGSPGEQVSADDPQVRVAPPQPQAGGPALPPGFRPKK